MSITLLPENIDPLVRQMQNAAPRVPKWYFDQQLQSYVGLEFSEQVFEATITDLVQIANADWRLWDAVHSGELELAISEKGEFLIGEIKAFQAKSKPKKKTGKKTKKATKKKTGKKTKKISKTKPKKKTNRRAPKKR